MARGKPDWRGGAIVKAFRISSLLMLVLSVVAISCASDQGGRRVSGVKSQESATAGIAAIKSLAVIDFFEAKPVDAPGKSYSCHVTGLIFGPGEVTAGSGEVVADQFRYYLAEQGFVVAPEPETVKAAANIRLGDASSYNVAQAVEAGMKLGVDAVVLGSVMRFEERVGTKFSVDKPASVSFSVALVNVRKGEIIWKAKFEKTQQPLFSNIMDFGTFVKGGMVWQTADRLAGIGVESVVNSMQP